MCQYAEEGAEKPLMPLITVPIRNVIRELTGENFITREMFSGIPDGNLILSQL